MPSFELNRLQAVTGARALSDTDRMTQGAADKGRAASTDAGSAKPASGGISLEIGTAAQAGAIDASSAPVNNDRVSQIRDALRNGAYPLVPAKIADAMIAAQYSFEIER